MEEKSDNDGVKTKGKALYVAKVVFTILSIARAILNVIQLISSFVS